MNVPYLHFNEQGIGEIRYMFIPIHHLTRNIKE